MNYKNKILLVIFLIIIIFCLSKYKENYKDKLTKKLKLLIKNIKEEEKILLN